MDTPKVLEVKEAVDTSDESTVDMHDFLVSANADLAVDDVEAEVIYGYKHKSISRFTVGDFEFKDHILRIPASKVEEFKNAYRGLEMRDQVQIVQLREVQNEIGVLESRTMRGVAGTDFIKAPIRQEPNAMVKSGTGTGLPALKSTDGFTASNLTTK